MRHSFVLAALAASALAVVSLPSQAQVGFTRWEGHTAQPLTLVYPTAATSTPTVMGPFTLDVALDAPPSPGKRPLILLSHGTGGNPLPDHDLAATLVRAGFVVAQLTHAGDNHLDTSRAGPESFRLRPQEATEALDALAADPVWSDRLNLSRVGVHGMSAGGVTALSLAGGQWRLLDLLKHCHANLEADKGFCLNGALTPEQQTARAASYQRAASAPERWLPAELTTFHGGRPASSPGSDPRPDPRIASVTAAVPVAAIYSPESLARIRVPVGLVTATHDEVLVPQFHSQHVLAHCTSCTLLSPLPGGHFDLLSPWPASVASTAAAQQVRGGSVTPGFDPAIRQAAHARMAAFHRQNLMP